MPLTVRWRIAGLLLLAFALRLPGLFANSFHADEALYASWARLIHAGHDPLLQTIFVDKPPLLFYLQAAFFPLFGPLEWAARLPNWIASLLLIPLLARLAWRLYGDEWAALATAVVAVCSPFLIQFSATAFTDPLMLTLAVAAVSLMADGRPAWSGLAWGLATAVKHQALFFLPLLLVAPFAQSRYRFLAGTLPALLSLLAWEWAQGGDNTLTAALFSFGGLRLAWSWELWPRLLGWLKLLPLLISAPLVGGALLIIRALSLSKGGLSKAGFDRLNHRRTLFLLPSSFFLFTFAYLLFHWLTAVPVWDRFLLPLAPFAALFIGALFAESRAKSSNRQLAPLGALAPWRKLFLTLLLLALLPGAILAANGRYPIGGTRQADQGAAQLAQFLADEPHGTVLYDHWYSWQWRYHLFDSRVYLSWFAHPAALVEDLTVFAGDDHARYLVVTAGDGRLPVERAVKNGGFILEERYTAVNADGQPTMILYQVKRP